MTRAKPSSGTVAAQQDSPAQLAAEPAGQRHPDTAKSKPRTVNEVGDRHPASSPIRLTLAPLLGDKIDGAWWPRTGLISRELTDLVSILDVRLGPVIDINVNWSSLQRQPDLNWYWSQGARPHVMTVVGRDAQARLVIVPHATGAALAVMVLRRAANLPIAAAHRDSRAGQVAECIVRMARGEHMFEVRRSRRVAQPATTHD